MFLNFTCLPVYAAAHIHGYIHYHPIDILLLSSLLLLSITILHFLLKVVCIRLTDPLHKHLKEWWYIASWGIDLTGPEDG